MPRVDRDFLKPVRLERLEPRILLSTTIGYSGLFQPPLPRVFAVTAANGQLLLANDDGPHGHELWRSDGTAQGSSLLKDINPGLADSLTSNPQLFTIGPFTYFTAKDPDHGLELWKTDGTSAGTALVKDIEPGVDDSNAANFTNVNGLLYFTAIGDNQMRLWKSDGSSAGTVQV